jgi:hypothetical protein
LAGIPLPVFFRAGFHDPVNLCSPYGENLFTVKKVFAIMLVSALLVMPEPRNIRI